MDYENKINDGINFTKCCMLQMCNGCLPPYSVIIRGAMFMVCSS